MTIDGKKALETVISWVQNSPVQLDVDVAIAAREELASLEAAKAKAEAERDEWFKETERLRDAHIATSRTKLMKLPDVIEWLKDHRHTHSDWASWFEQNPQDPRQKSVGSAKFHRDAEARYNSMIECLEALKDMTAMTADDAKEYLMPILTRLADVERRLALIEQRPSVPRCAECHGNGVVNRSFGYVPCEACNGKGY